MVQVLKDHVKQQISDAAERLFARVGYQKATMGMIAEEAGVATGTIYKYYKNKQVLFESIITEAFVAEFKQLTHKRVASLIDPSQAKESTSIENGAAGQLLRFWIDNRLKVIIVLARAEGSRYASFEHDYIEAMALQALIHLPLTHPDFNDSKIFRFVFNARLVDTVKGIVSILETFDQEQDIRDAFSLGWTYHFAGINAVIAQCRQGGEK